MTSPRILRVTALLLTAAVVVLHLYYSSRAGGLWRDEVHTAATASMPSLSEIWAHLPLESFPILWPLIVRVFQSLAGDSDFALRLLGCFVGLSVVAALWLNARLLKLGVPVVSLALLGFNPIVVRYGDSLRAYGVGLCLVLLTFALVWKVAHAPSARTTILAALAAIGSAQALYHNAVGLFAIGLAGAAVAAKNRHWSRALIILGIGSLAAVSLLPYLAVIQRKRSWDIVSLRDVDLSVFWTRFYEAISAAGTGWLWIAVLLLASGVALIAQFRARVSSDNESRDLALYSLLALLISIPASLGFLKMVSYPTQPWYHLPLMGLLAIAAEGCLSTARPQFAVNIGRAGIAAGIALISFVPAWHALQPRQTNIDLLAAQLETAAAPEDTIVIAPWYLGVTFHRYYTGTAAWITVPPIEDLRVQRYDLLKTQMENANAIEPVLQAIEQSLKSGHRVWVLGQLLLPEEGQRPPVFAPAPNESFGWHEGAYTGSWAMQIGYFLQQHATGDEAVPLSPAEPVSDYEAPPLSVIWGWR